MKKRLLFAIFANICLFGGIICGIAAVIKLEKYFHPWYFTFIFGGIGLGVGIYVERRFMSIMERTLLAHIRPDKIYLQITFGFIGFGLLGGVYFNRVLSAKHVTTYLVTTKDFSPRKGKYGPSYYVTFRTDAGDQEVKCDPDYWDRILPGKSYHVIHRKSMIGFDYLELPGED